MASWMVSHQAVHPLLGAARSAQPLCERAESIFLNGSDTGRKFDWKGASWPANPNTTALGHLVGLALQALDYADTRNLILLSMEEAFMEDVESHTHDKNAPLRPLSISQLTAMW